MDNSKKESNRLIIEFDMGGGDYSTDSEGTEFVELIPIGKYKLEDVPYHQWSWLIPVVQKIEKECEGVPPQLLHCSLYSEVTEVYDAVVAFLQEYDLTPKEVT